MIENAKFMFSYELWRHGHLPPDFTIGELYDIVVTKGTKFDSINVARINERARFTYNSLEQFLLDWEW